MLDVSVLQGCNRVFKSGGAQKPIRARSTQKIFFRAPLLLSRAPQSGGALERSRGALKKIFFQRPNWFLSPKA